MSGKISVKDLMPLIEEAFASGKTAVLPVIGISMSPLLANNRDAVVIKKCEDPYSLKKTDVPLYINAQGKFILHRIVKVNKYTYNMCGDRQVFSEKGVPKGNVVAVACGFIRNGKKISVNNKWYRLYSQLWLLLRPIRPILLKINYSVRGRLKGKK